METPTYLQEFALRTAAVLGTHVEAGITLRHRGVMTRAASSSHRAARCDRVEALTSAGPCIDAMNELRGHIIPDLLEETRWSEWREMALAQGIRAGVAMPAIVDPETTIAVNLYSDVVDPWRPALIAATDSYAQLAAGAVRLHLELGALDDATAGIYSRQSDHAVIEQAVGAIMVYNDCSLEEARMVLESGYRARNVPRREVAETILKTLAPAAIADPVRESSWRDRR